MKYMKKKQWFEKEDFWNNYGPVMFDGARWAEAPVVAEYVKKIAHLKEGDSVLDAGCGPGRISIELAALGLDVTGVDIIQSELDAAKESANDEGVELKLLKADLRTFESEKKFDCAVNLYTSFGYCATREEDFEILKHIHGALKEGGTFILECTSRETAILYFTEGEEFERAGMTVQTYFSVTGAWEGLQSKWDLIKKDGTKVEHEFVQRLYSASELCEIMKRAGFSDAKAYGDFDFSPYDQHARTMVIVALK
ncbi:MAG: methyltransferase domain-containing protein [Treponema sp.]|nr:methyltransferase domain-containing protein [Treponema sp.]